MEAAERAGYTVATCRAGGAERVSDIDTGRVATKQTRSPSVCVLCVRVCALESGSVAAKLDWGSLAQILATQSKGVKRHCKGSHFAFAPPAASRASRGVAGVAAPAGQVSRSAGKVAQLIDSLTRSALIAMANVTWTGARAAYRLRRRSCASRGRVRATPHLFGFADAR